MKHGEKFEQKRRELLKAVIKLSAEHDIADMPVRQICTELDISIGSFYHYFEDKNDLLMQVFYTIEDYIHSQCDAELTDDWQHNLRLIVDAFAEYNRLSGVNMVFIVQGQEAAGTEYAKSMDKYSLQTVTDRFDSGLLQGQIAPRYSSRQLTRMLFAIVRGVIMDWARNDGNSDLHSMVNMALEIFLAGISA